MHADLDRLNSDYATLLRSTYLRPAEPGPALAAGPTFSASLSPHGQQGSAGATLARLGRGEQELQPAVSSEPAPVIVVCTTCRQPIRRNETLGISFCPIHGLSQPFTFIPLGQRRLREA
ncbi:MAG: hypothetical protein ACHQ0I_01700 [Candidatus Lutacidiplasmatales archaeon]